MKFELGAEVFEFSKGASYSVSRPKELLQVTDRAADGSLQVEDVGDTIAIGRRLLNLIAIPQRDFIELRRWFLVVAEGARYPFTFTDELGCVGEVCIVSPEFDLLEISLGRFSGTIMLEYV